MPVNPDGPLDKRPLHELLRLPASAWVSPKEAAAVLGISVEALATRRSRGEWPTATKLGCRLIRYRLGELLRLESGHDDRMSHQ